jgi:hypothetical protein
MANVSFKRGLLANLPNAKTDGAIYVTTDERAMYIDYDNGTTTERIRLGDFREYANWAAIQAITNPNLSTTALYYATEENILCKWTGSAWKQINSQKSLTNLISSMIYMLNNVAAGANDNGGVSSNLRIYQNATTYKEADSPLKFVGVGGVQITKGTSQINIGASDTVDTAKVSTSSITGGVQIAVTTDRSGVNADGTAINTLNVSGGSFNLKGGGGVQVTKNGDDVTISGGAITDISQTYTAQGEHQIIVTDGAGTKTAKYTPEIEYGAGSTKSTAKFISGKASLSIYTKDEVDNKISAELKAINAMTYRGSLGTGGQFVVNGNGLVAPASATSTPTDIHSGDVFVVSNTANASLISGTSPKIGDMWIASGTEGTDGVIPAANITWTYIPSGDEAIHTYKFGLNGTALTLYDEADNVRGKATPGNTGSDSASEIVFGGTGTSLTITHAAHALSTTAETAATQSAKTNLVFTAVTDVITNASGHVTGIKTKQITVVDTHNGVTAVSKTVTVTARSGSTVYDKATIGTLVTTNDDPTGKSGSVEIRTESLTLSKPANGILAIEMTWGSF